MIKVSIEIDENEMEFTVPENWDEVTIGQFIELFSIERQNSTPFEMAAKTISIFTGIKEEILLMMNYVDFNKLTEVLSFTGEDVIATPSESIELDGETYYIRTDFEKFTMGEIISLEVILKQGDGNIFKVMDKLLCVFLRKKKENGKFETFTPEMMERVNVFNRAPISKVYNVFSFFLDGGVLSANNIQDFLENPS